jgi:hypothetical protein
MPAASKNVPHHQAHPFPPAAPPAVNHSGYLVSQQQLRARLMQIEWDGSLRLWSQRKGLAEFEHWLADKGQQEGVTVEWSNLQVRGKQA